MSDIKYRGFASMTPERRKEISRLGGIAVQRTGKGHRYSSAEAKVAGAKGLVVRQAKRGVSRSS